MIKNNMKNKLILFSFLLMTSTSVFTGCGPLNNPFLPSAELSVTKISSADAVNGVSILQSFKKSGSFLMAEYKYNEPTISIVNKPGLPRVIFKQVIAEYTLGDKKLPALNRPITITIPSGGTFDGSVPILSLSDDLRNSVFPNDTFFGISSGLAEVTLLGIDDNNNVIATKFTTPIKFQTDPAGFVAPSASPIPVASPTP